MFLVGLISWWYGRGWVEQWRRIGGRFMATVEFFSIGQLLATFFAPFRQISANTASDGSFSAEVGGLFDKVLSRTIGATVRFFTIVFGMFVIMLQAAYEVVIMAAWWVLPLLPIAGLIMFAVGWVPVWI